MDQSALLNHVLKGDVPAIQLANDFFEFSQILDDLWDKDKPVSNDQLLRMAKLALVHIPKNAFFIHHQVLLAHVIDDTLNRWVEASDLEEKKELLYVSYITRSSTTNLLIKMAYLIGGDDWGRQAAYDINKAIYSDNESYETYKEEHG